MPSAQDKDSSFEKEPNLKSSNVGNDDNVSFDFCDDNSLESVDEPSKSKSIDIGSLVSIMDTNEENISYLSPDANIFIVIQWC